LRSVSPRIAAKDFAANPGGDDQAAARFVRALPSVAVATVAATASSTTATRSTRRFVP
jgi:hypothetical protein